MREIANHNAGPSFLLLLRLFFSFLIRDIRSVFHDAAAGLCFPQILSTVFIKFFALSPRVERPASARLYAGQICMPHVKFRNFLLWKKYFTSNECSDLWKSVLDQVYVRLIKYVMYSVCSVMNIFWSWLDKLFYVQ